MPQLVKLIFVNIVYLVNKKCEVWYNYTPNKGHFGLCSHLCMGPTKNASLGGKRWFVTFIDDYTRRVWMYPMRHKNEVLQIFLEWKKMVKNQTDKKIKKLRSDNGGEYTYDLFLKVCRDEGIIRHFIIPGKP